MLRPARKSSGLNSRHKKSCARNSCWRPQEEFSRRRRCWDDDDLNHHHDYDHIFHKWLRTMICWDLNAWTSPLYKPTVALEIVFSCIFGGYIKAHVYQERQDRHTRRTLRMEQLIIEDKTYKRSVKVPGFSKCSWFPGSAVFLNPSWWTWCICIMYIQWDSLYIHIIYAILTMTLLHIPALRHQVANPNCVVLTLREHSLQVFSLSYLSEDAFTIRNY